MLFLMGASGILSAPLFPAQKSNTTPLYHLTIEPKSTKAVAYPYMGVPVTIRFRGTPFAPDARGTATIHSRSGSTLIRASLDKLDPASKFGPNALTYVMWAVTPEGRAQNLGEVVLHGREGQLNATTSLETFALVVTAEPYFAVSDMGDVVVLENVVPKKTAGTVEDVNTRRELFSPESTTLQVSPADLKPVDLDKNTPLELYQARLALKAAQAADADAYASEIYKKAMDTLQQAEDLHSRRSKKPELQTMARRAIQTAEDARVIAVRRKLLEHGGQKRSASSESADPSSAQAQVKRKLGAAFDVKETDRTLSVNLPDSVFAPGDADLKSDGKDKLNKVAAAVAGLQGIKVEIKGFADDLGEQFAGDLSHDRAQMVRAYLVAQGVPPGTITAQGGGGDKPWAANDKEEEARYLQGVQIVVSFG